MGKIVMPKNSALLEEVEAVLKIYYEADGWISNDEYKTKLKAIIGDDQYASSYTKKSQITSYFGFTEWQDINNVRSLRRITQRGKSFYKNILSSNTEGIIEDLVNSLEVVTFGRNNFGCPDSDSDIEPPVVFVRTVLELGYLTYKEFAYLLWKLEDCGANYTDCLRDIRQLRANDHFELNHTAQKYTDAKPIMILIRWGLLAEGETVSGNKQIIIPSNNLEKFEKRIKNLKIYNIDKDIIDEPAFDYGNDVNVDDNEKKFRKWMAKQITVNGTPCTASMISNNCSALKKICSLMEIAKYPDLESIFEIIDMDVFVDVKNIIQSHPDYEEANKDCGNGFLRTGFKWYEKFLNKVAEDETINKQALLGNFDFSTSNITDGQNLIVYGTPGCGKSYYVEHTLLKDYPTENYVRTTFFQDYTNTDFVGQILPVVEGDKVTYKFNPGPFTLALEQAIKKPNEKIALVIEELNRGSAASIFGDIFQLLDRKEGVSEYSINNVNIINYLKDQFKDEYTFDSIKLPGNLSIYATMNTSDQNVFTLDTAFKRRWKFKKLLNKFENDHRFKDKYIPGIDITWKKFVDSVNAHILNTSGGLNSEDKQLGVYFVDDKGMRTQISDVSEIQEIEDFAYKVLEYLWADVAKFNRDDWFDKEIKSLDDLVAEYKKRGIEVFADDVFNK